MMDFTNLEVHNTGKVQQAAENINTLMTSIAGTVDMIAQISSMNLKVSDAGNALLKSFELVGANVNDTKAKVSKSFEELLDGVAEVQGRLNAEVSL